MGVKKKKLLLLIAFYLLQPNQFGFVGCATAVVAQL